MQSAPLTPARRVARPHRTFPLDPGTRRASASLPDRRIKGNILRQMIPGLATSRSDWRAPARAGRRAQHAPRADQPPSEAIVTTRRPGGAAGRPHIPAGMPRRRGEATRRWRSRCRWVPGFMIARGARATARLAVSCCFTVPQAEGPEGQHLAAGQRSCLQGQRRQSRKRRLPPGTIVVRERGPDGTHVRTAVAPPPGRADVAAGLRAARSRRRRWGRRSSRAGVTSSS